MQQTWEYKTIKVKTGFGASDPVLLLNDLGVEGWELVAVTPTGASLTCFFKREVLNA